MGLFGNKEARELRQLLDALQGSTLRDIDRIRAGDPPPDHKSMPEMSLNNRITRAAQIVHRMTAKGRGTEAEAILDEFRARPVPQVVLFRAAQPTRESFGEAAAQAAVQLESMPENPEQAAKDEQWREVIDEIRARVERLGR